MIQKDGVYKCDKNITFPCMKKISLLRDLQFQV